MIQSVLLAMELVVPNALSESLMHSEMIQDHVCDYLDITDSIALYI